MHARMKFIRAYFFILFIFSAFHSSYGQLYSKDVLASRRSKLYQNTIQRVVMPGISLPFTRENNEQVTAALQAMIFYNFSTAYTDAQIQQRLANILSNSDSCNIALLQYLIAQKRFSAADAILPLLQSNDAELLMLTAHYIQKSKDSAAAKLAAMKLANLLKVTPDSLPVYQKLLLSSHSNVSDLLLPKLDARLFTSPGYLPGKVVVVCILNTDRHLPGQIMVRDTAGNWIKDVAGNIASLPVLALSHSNLPYYYKGGNTPQGVFLMNGFSVSKNGFIGPTPNVQLGLPFEKPARLFFGNDTDSIYTVGLYKNLLPEKYRQHPPLMQAYHAGALGRNEIIAHGSTGFPGFYRGKSFYGFTPSEGCLSFKEDWDDATGYLISSDQLKLNELLVRAGGPFGYWIVVEGEQDN